MLRGRRTAAWCLALALAVTGWIHAAPAEDELPAPQDEAAETAAVREDVFPAAPEPEPVPQPDEETALPEAEPDSASAEAEETRPTLRPDAVIRPDETYEGTLTEDEPSILLRVEVRRTTKVTVTTSGIPVRLTLLEAHGDQRRQADEPDGETWFLTEEYCLIRVTALSADALGSFTLLVARETAGTQEEALPDPAEAAGTAEPDDLAEEPAGEENEPEAELPAEDPSDPEAEHDDMAAIDPATDEDEAPEPAASTAGSDDPQPEAETEEEPDAPETEPDTEETDEAGTPEDDADGPEADILSTGEDELEEETAAEDPDEPGLDAPSDDPDEPEAGDTEFGADEPEPEAAADDPDEPGPEPPADDPDEPEAGDTGYGADEPEPEAPAEAPADPEPETPEEDPCLPADGEGPSTQSVEVRVYISIGEAEELRPGVEVVLTGEVTGLDGPFALRWQYSPDGGLTVIDVEDATDWTYRFVVDEENIGYLWRLSVIPLEPED